MTDPNCIFCKIVSGAIPSRKVYEDENCYAFMDIAPFEKGHTLVVPKHHARFLTDLTEATLTQLIMTTLKVAAYILKTMPCDGFNILQNNGECALQTIPHVHFHIIPRWNNKGLQWHSTKAYDSEEEMVEIHKRIIINE
jgi:histidine triad (HIT) family protein